MMDDKTKAALDAIMARMNDGFERVLKEITMLKVEQQQKIELERQIRIYGR
jgi:hypothetical protein